jgi:hypothetical protein
VVKNNNIRNDEMKLKYLAIPLVLSTLAGCSSIVSKSDYAVSINSTPDDAKFVITNKAGQSVHSGVTPAVINLKSSAGYFKGETYTIALEKEGYSPKLFTLASTVDGWYFGNILFGGLLGMLVIDPATGAMYNLPDRVDISLDANVSTRDPQEVHITTIDTLTLEELERLERVM